MPWCDRLIESEPVQHIVAKVRSDHAAHAASTLALVPKLESLSTDIRFIELGGEQIGYQAEYLTKYIDEGEDEIIISLGGSYSVMLFPSRQGRDAYKVGMSEKIVPAFHYLLGSGHSYSPDPLIDSADNRSFVERLVNEVANDLALDPAVSQRVEERS